MEGCKFLDKRLGRAAVAKAWPSLSRSSREAILLKLQGAYTHVRRKVCNIKTGKRTSEHCRALVTLLGSSGNLEVLPVEAARSPGGLPVEAAPDIPKVSLRQKGPSTSRPTRVLKVHVSAEDPADVAALYGVGVAATPKYRS